jgi:hypothetical protein
VVNNSGIPFPTAIFVPPFRPGALHGEQHLPTSRLSPDPARRPFFPFAHPSLLLVSEPVSRLSDEHSMRSRPISIF